MKIPSSFNPRGKTNAQLADEFGVSVRTISRWKAAMRNAPVKVAEVELTTDPAPVPENVKYQYVVSPAFVNIVRIEDSNVETVVILSSDQRYQKAVDLIAAHASLEEFFVKAKLRQAAIHTSNEVTIDETGVSYKDFKLQGEMADAITAMFIEDRLDANSNLVHFIDNLVQNPDSRVLAQLYPFVLHNDIQISDDGYILAYKKSARTTRISIAAQWITRQARYSRCLATWSRTIPIKRVPLASMCVQRHTSNILVALMTRW